MPPWAERVRTPKNGVGTCKTGIPHLGPVWQDFLGKRKILGQFNVVSFQISTIYINLVEDTTVLRVHISYKGELKTKREQSLSIPPGAADTRLTGTLSRPHGPYRLPQSMPHWHSHLDLLTSKRPGALREHWQADPLPQDRQDGRGRLPAPPPGRAGVLYPAQRLVSKEWLLVFLVSKDCNSIIHKSKAHYAMIATVAPKSRRAKKPLKSRTGEHFHLKMLP